MKNTHVDIGLRGMISYDKLKLIQDMVKGSEIHFGKAQKKKY